MLEFFVEGNPVPKQSFNMGKYGGYPKKGVKEWEELIGWQAKLCHRGTPLQGNLQVDMQFYLGHKRRVDLDNLSKSVLDGMNGIVYEDDRQVVKLYLEKYYDKERPGVMVTVKELDEPNTTN